MCVSAMKPLQALKAVEVSVISWKQLKREPVLYTRVTSSLSPTSHLAWMCIITGVSSQYYLKIWVNLSSCLEIKICSDSESSYTFVSRQDFLSVSEGGAEDTPPPPPPSSQLWYWDMNWECEWEEARDSSELTHPHHGYRWLCFLPSLFKTSRKDEPYSALVVASVSVNKMHHFTVKPSAEALWFTSSQVYRRIHILCSGTSLSLLSLFPPRIISTAVRLQRLSTNLKKKKKIWMKPNPQTQLTPPCEN